MSERYVPPLPVYGRIGGKIVTPAKPKTIRAAPKPVDHDGLAVKAAIAAATGEKRAKIAAEAAHKANQRRILAQVAGIPESEVDELLK